MGLSELLVGVPGEVGGGGSSHSPAARAVSLQVCASLLPPRSPRTDKVTFFLLLLFYFKFPCLKQPASEAFAVDRQKRPGICTESCKWKTSRPVPSSPPRLIPAQQNPNGRWEEKTTGVEKGKGGERGWKTPGWRERFVACAKRKKTKPQTKRKETKLRNMLEIMETNGK